MRLLIMFLASIACTQFAFGQFRFPKPKVPTKPPTRGELQEAIASAGKDINQAWQKIQHLNPATASEEAWGEAGRVAYVAAARIMSKRSPTGERLDKNTKHHLRKFYGDLVDRVSVHWGTPLLDEWAASRFKVRLTDTDSEAQTYGHDIYCRWRKNEKPETYLMMLMSHELMHARQYERYDSSLSNFGYHYFKNYKKANLNYENNRQEREAYEDSPRVAAPSVYLERQRGSNGNAAQRWILNDAGSGYKTIVNVRLSKELGTNMVLDYRKGNLVYLEEQRGENGNQAQRWRVESIDNGLYVIANNRLSREKGTSMVLDYQGRNAAYLESKRGQRGNKAQRWKLRGIGGGEYVIENVRRSGELKRPMVLDYRD